MRNILISLPTAGRVQTFVGTLTGLDGDFELLFDKYIIDARSLMGIFSLDLSRPLQLKIYNDSDENLQALQPFMAEKEGEQV